MYLAAKILTIDATHRHNAGKLRELEFLTEIEACNFLSLLRDHFIEQRPMGKHICLVQDLYSTSVSSLRRSPSKTLLPQMVRNVFSILVDALAQLHAMHIAHIGSPDPN
jgi:serine/threonine-protein kinase SRPK3